MYNFLWNISLVGTVSFIGWVCLNIYDRSLAENIKTNICWYSVRSYHYVNLKCNKGRQFIQDKISNYDISNNKKNDELQNYKISSNNEILPDSKQLFIGYKINDKSVFEKDVYKLEKNNYFKDTHFDLMMVKETINDTDYFIVINNKNSIDSIVLEPSSKCFLQVEISLNSNEEKLEIHDNLKHFYVNKSEILSKPFLHWYLEKYYNIIDPLENYTLHFIDSNINIFKCKSDKLINIVKDCDSKYLLTDY